MNPRELPVYELRESLIRNLQAGHRLLVKAPTGSGKSTQVPQIILDHVLAPDKEIVVLEPRRVAARLLARRVAFERQGVLGHEVGYHVRFERMISPSTRLRYVTEGILLRELILDPALSRVGAVVFDEFHERHIYGDVTLGHCLRLQETLRKDLRVVVMSATVETGHVESFLDPCSTLVSEGRMYPVSVEYLNQPVDFGREAVWKAATAVLLNQFRKGHVGDVLMFMPGVYEVSKTIDEIRKHSEFRGWDVLPLHGDLPLEAQDRAVGEHTVPRIVVATNVAESSVTIDGIRLVVDSGLARIPRFDPHRGINTLLVQKVSQASAEQRAGRAGRTGPGRAVRLWTHREHGQRPVSEVPEIKRLDLAEIALTLKALGFTNLDDFPWLEQPDPKAVNRAESLLHDLGATDLNGSITDVGRRMVAFPVYPRFSRLLLEADRLGCVPGAALVAALAQGRSIMLKRPGGAVRD
ncbi:MAG: helicase-related protein, partial [Thermodesulfobacteriota bacterium]